MKYRVVRACQYHTNCDTGKERPEVTEWRAEAAARVHALLFSSLERVLVDRGNYDRKAIQMLDAIKIVWSAQIFTELFRREVPDHPWWCPTPRTMLEIDRDAVLRAMDALREELIADAADAERGAQPRG